MGIGAASGFSGRLLAFWCTTWYLAGLQGREERTRVSPAPKKIVSPHSSMLTGRTAERNLGHAGVGKGVAVWLHRFGFHLGFLGGAPSGASCLESDNIRIFG